MKDLLKQTILNELFRKTSITIWSDQQTWFKKALLKPVEHLHSSLRLDFLQSVQSLINNANLAWISIDATHAWVHQSNIGAADGCQTHEFPHKISGL